ncbi:hypothetical protein H2199_001181 [Coniosporium tulheliwenetii]|uniref:Uncharacterized protein n=1 Tax=Coniosporium tulheliwenetii TaxID=3383036 RepID=A0ACC2ZLB9_9PEZI|nr:hypothetical protein H2199_001181 [Cladosporium sp. JES 115]
MSASYPSSPVADSLRSLGSPTKTREARQDTIYPTRLLPRPPRELRDQIYNHFFSIPNYDHPFDRRIERERSDVYSGTPRSLGWLLGEPLLQVNESISYEATEALFTHHTVLFVCGPGVLLDVLSPLPRSLTQKLRHIEHFWLTPPRDLADTIYTIDEEELGPLFRFFSRHLRLKSLTIPLQFLGTEYRELPPRTWYSIMCAVRCIALLDAGALDTFHIRYEPRDLWAVLDRRVDLREMIRQDPREWDLEHYEALGAVQEELQARPCSVRLVDLVADMRVGPRSREDEEGLEALISLRDWRWGSGVRVPFKIVCTIE